MYFLYKEILPLDRHSDIPVYVQISNKLTQLIAAGRVEPGDKLPSTRRLSELLGVHRRTVVMAFDELIAQGFIETRPSAGTFVSVSLPVVNPQAVASPGGGESRRAGFRYEANEVIQKPFYESKQGLSIDEGLPDLRLSPTEEIRRTYNGFATRRSSLRHWSYGSPAGDKWLRDELVRYLRQTRGISLTTDNIMITRGSQMGLYLATQLLCSNQGETRVAVGRLNYMTANMTIRHAGAQLVTVPIDEEGLQIDCLEGLCQEGDGIRAVYVTSHHHHPTTVTLSANRRLQLMRLAAAYEFAIIEDDYDYDFHYARTPLLPLASLDKQSQVIYVGGFSKVLSPALRIGFLVGPSDFVQDAIYLRRIIDRQGDTLMERTLAQMIANGDIQRHCKKALKVYEERRALFDAHLTSLRDVLTYKVPEGGMAYWVGLDKSIRWASVRDQLAAKKLHIPHWENYDPWQEGHNHLRLGFASLNTEEMSEAFDLLKSAIHAQA